jgi:hypothetical protein
LYILSAALATAFSAHAQTNLDALNKTAVAASGSPTQTFPSQTNEVVSYAQKMEKIRAVCIESRRFICGKILKVLPDGVVVESGYTNLLRAPLNKSWFAPSAVSATRADNLIEGSKPNSIGVGLFFLTNLPDTPRAKPKLYDFVMIEGYPAGQYIYSPVGDVHQTIREFSASLDAAIQWKLNHADK